MERNRIGFGIEGGGREEKKKPQVIRRYYRDKSLPVDGNLLHTTVFSAISKARSSEVPSAKGWRTWTWHIISCCGTWDNESRMSFGTSEIWLWIAAQPLKTGESVVSYWPSIYNSLSFIFCKVVTIMTNLQISHEFKWNGVYITMMSAKVTLTLGFNWHLFKLHPVCAGNPKLFPVSLGTWGEIGIKGIGVIDVCPSRGWP